MGVTIQYIKGSEDSKVSVALRYHADCGSFYCLEFKAKLADTYHEVSFTLYLDTREELEDLVRELAHVAGMQIAEEPPKVQEETEPDLLTADNIEVTCEKIAPHAFVLDNQGICHTCGLPVDHAVHCIRVTQTVDEVVKRSVDLNTGFGLEVPQSDHAPSDEAGSV